MISFTTCPIRTVHTTTATTATATTTTTTTTKTQTTGKHTLSYRLKTETQTEKDLNRKQTQSTEHESTFTYKYIFSNCMIGPLTPINGIIICLWLNYGFDFLFCSIIKVWLGQVSFDFCFGFSVFVSFVFERLFQFMLVWVSLV